MVTNVKLHASYTEVTDKLLPEITYKKEDIIRRRFENGESPEYIAEPMGIKLSSVSTLLGL